MVFCLTLRTYFHSLGRAAMRRTVFLCLFVLSGSVAGQIGSSSSMTDRYGTFYTFSAYPINFSDYYLYQNFRVWKGNADRSTGTTTTPVNIKDFSGVMGMQFGLFEGFDISVVTNFYQTPNRAPSIATDDIVSFFKTKDVPGGFVVNFRLVPWKLAKDKIRMGVMVTSKWETGPYANGPFQSYATEKNTVGIAWLTSYFQNPGAPDLGFSIHGNLQYVNHLDKGLYIGFFPETALRQAGQGAIADQAVATGNTTALRFALGGMYPFNLGGTTMWVIGDVYGNAFMSKPPAAAYTRQNSAFAALGVKYQFARWLAVHIGGEFQVYKGTTPTYSNPALGVEDLTVSKSDFPSWRVFGGFSVTPSPHARFIKTKRQIAIETAVDPEEARKKEVENVLYSEQEIQKRRVNFEPVREMRKDYRTTIGELIGVLAPKDKKVDDGGGQ